MICGQLENCTLTFVCLLALKEEEGMEEIPKEILNAIDTFNVESDEEFLGFE